MKLSSMAFLEGFYYFPRIDWELLNSPLGDDLIVLSACQKGELPYSFFEDDKVVDDLSKAEEIIDRHAKRFGDDYYIEIQSHEAHYQLQFNEVLIHLAKKKGIPMVVTTDAHFLKRESYQAHQALVCLSRGTTLGRLKESGDELYGPWFYLQTPEDMEQYINKDILFEALMNTDIIANKVEDFSIGLDRKEPYLIEYEVPE